MKKAFRGRGAALSTLVIGSALSACNGGGGAPSQVAQTTSTKQLARVELNLVVPHQLQSRHALYVSSATMALKITVTATGADPTVFVFPCTTTCNGSFVAPVGSDQIALALSDQSDGSGNVLSLSTTNQTILANVTNTLNLTANPVVDHVALVTTGAAVLGGVPSDTTVTIAPYDSAGRLIVGPGAFVDANGNALTLNLSISNVSAGGTGSMAITGTTSFSDAGALATTVHYDGNWLAQSTLQLTSSRPISGSSATTSIPVTPNVVNYTAGIPYDISQNAITLGPDGNIWFGETGPAIGRIASDGSVTEFSQNLSGGISSITVGPDNALWYTGSSSNVIGRIALDGTITEYSAGLLPASGGLSGIVTAADGNLWFLDDLANRIGTVTPAGVITEFTLAASTFGPRNLVVGADHNLWINDTSTGCISRFVTSTHALTPYCGFHTAAVNLVLGADNAVYSVDFGGYIDRVTVAGVTSEIFDSGNLVGIANGVDGNLWLTAQFQDRIDRLEPDGTITSFSSGIVPNSEPYKIVPDASGHLWIASKNSINKFTY